MQINEPELYKFMGSTDSRLQAIESSIKGFGVRVGDLEGRLSKCIIEKTPRSFMNGSKPIIISSGAASIITAFLMWLINQ